MSRLTKCFVIGVVLLLAIQVSLAGKHCGIAPTTVGSYCTDVRFAY